jgi:hypothetical protein
MKLFRRGAVAALIVLTLGACGSGSAGVSPSVAPALAPATFDEFSTQFCGALTSLIRAVGNPDVGSPSILSKALDDAVAAADPGAADRAAAAMLTELELGRQHAAAAARYQPAIGTVGDLDRVLVAFGASVTAKRALAHTPGSADPQKAFEQAGGVEAWTGLLQGMRTMPLPSGAVPKDCPAMRGQA